ncbi:MAG TPA: VOC family protein [Acidimicrobiales bacterium]|nr:VOC family protein [Acidimicrobiales bacterium]
MWRYDHVQLAIPVGAEESCDRFYVDVLGFAVLEKPPVLAARGGRWYRRDDVELHLGVTSEFVPAIKAHPGLVVEDYDALHQRLLHAGTPPRDDDALEGVRRCYVDDPVGNRLELIDARNARRR